MAPSFVCPSWLNATVRALVKRVHALEQERMHKPFKLNANAPVFVPRPPGVHLPPTSISNAEFANLLYALHLENDQVAVNPTEFSHDNSLLTLQEVNALDEEDRNVYFEDCLPEHLRPPDCIDLDLDDGETMKGIYEPDESEFENDTTHNTPANKTHMKTVTFMESDEVCTFATSTPSSTPATPPSSFAPRISSSSSAPPSSFTTSTPPSFSSSSARTATVSRQLIRKGKKDMNGHDDSDDSDFDDDTSRPSWAKSAFREPPKGKNKKEIKRLIMEIYAKHNPSKLADVDKLMSKYKGRELEVLEAICDKYA